MKPAIDRRAMLKAWIVGGAIAFTNSVARATETFASLPDGSEAAAASLKAEDVKRIALTLFDYRLPGGDAAAIAGATDSTLKLLRHGAREGRKALSGVEPAFAYAIVVAEAQRLRRRGHDAA